MHNRPLQVELLIHLPELHQPAELIILPTTPNKTEVVHPEAHQSLVPADMAAVIGEAMADQEATEEATAAEIGAAMVPPQEEIGASEAHPEAIGMEDPLAATATVEVDVKVVSVGAVVLAAPVVASETGTEVAVAVGIGILEIAPVVVVDVTSEVAVMGVATGVLAGTPMVVTDHHGMTLEDPVVPRAVVEVSKVEGADAVDLVTAMVDSEADAEVLEATGADLVEDVVEVAAEATKSSFLRRSSSRGSLNRLMSSLSMMCSLQVAISLITIVLDSQRSRFTLTATPVRTRVNV